MCEVSHFVVKFKSLYCKQKLWNDICIGTVSRQYEEFHYELDFFESLKNFVRIRKFG